MGLQRCSCPGTVAVRQLAVKVSLSCSVGSGVAWDFGYVDGVSLSLRTIVVRCTAVGCVVVHDPQKLVDASQLLVLLSQLFDALAWIRMRTGVDHYLFSCFLVDEGV